MRAQLHGQAEPTNNGAGWHQANKGQNNMRCSRCWAWLPPPKESVVMVDCVVGRSSRLPGCMKHAACCSPQQRTRSFARPQRPHCRDWERGACTAAEKDGSIRRADRNGRGHTQHNSGLELYHGVALTLPYLAARAARAEANALQEPQLR